MRIRIFGDAPDPAEFPSWTNTVVQSLCQLARRGSGDLSIELCDPMTWGSRCSVADLHIYLTEPCRMAVPWAACNVALVSRAWWATLGEKWLPWAGTEIDLFVVLGADAPPAGIPADRMFALRAAARGVTASPLRIYADSWRRLMDVVDRRRHPPALPAAPLSRSRSADFPRVGVITLTRNRPQWWPIMVRNVANARWPLKQIEWIIVDDSDEGKGVAGQVEALREKSTELTVNYVRLTPGSTIGAKRNAAVAAASAGTDLFVCMDDDDHYPDDSIGRRVSWLATRPEPVGRGVAYCATIPMYDTTRYISAINSPPMVIGAAQRVSEATLAFTRTFWEERPFPEVSMAEGEGFIAGREKQAVEIPPYGVIVSFIHRGNTSSRRVPADQPANGCHYGFSDEFFSLVTEIGMK